MKNSQYDEKREELLLEFNQRNKVLSKFAVPIHSPLELFNQLGFEAKCPIVIGKRTSVIDPLNALGNSKAYFSYVKYFNDFINEGAIEYVPAIVVTIRNISAKGLTELFMKSLKLWREKPNYIHNSGVNIHLIWILEEPIYSFKSKVDNMETAKALQKIVTGKIRSTCKKNAPESIVPIRKIGQLYRIPCALNEIGCQSTLFQFDNEKLSPKTIKEKYKLKLIPKFKKNESNEPIFNKKEVAKPWYIKHSEIRKNKKEMKELGEVVECSPNCHNTFYDWCKKQVFSGLPGVRQGQSRGLVMNGLAIAAYKSCVDKSVLEKDLRELMGLYNKSLDNQCVVNNSGIDVSLKKTTVSSTYIRGALNHYCENSKKVKAQQLEFMLGIWFPKLHRNQTGMTRAENCREQSRKKSNDKIRMITENRLKYPKAGKREVARLANVDIKTVRKHWNITTPQKNAI